MEKGRKEKRKEITKDGGKNENYKGKRIKGGK